MSPGSASSSVVAGGAEAVCSWLGVLQPGNYVAPRQARVEMQRDAIVVARVPAVLSQMVCCVGWRWAGCRSYSLTSGWLLSPWPVPARPGGGEWLERRH